MATVAAVVKALSFLSVNFANLSLISGAVKNFLTASYPFLGAVTTF